MNNGQLWKAAKTKYADNRKKGQPLWHQLTPAQREELFREAKASSSK